MNLLKKLTAWSLALIMILSMAACSGKAKTDSASESSSQTSPTESSIPQISGAVGVEITPEGDEETIWGGKPAKGIALGGGTEEYPFMIQSPSELAYAISSGGNGYYYELTKDIYLNDVSDEKWYEKKNVNPWYTNEFEGHINGAGYCVYGIWYPEDNCPKNGGLIAVMNEGSVKNLGIRQSRIVVQAYGGGIVGIASGSGQKTFESCFADETVTVVYTVDNTNGAGGLIGYAGSGGSLDKPAVVIKNCYSKAKLGGYDSKYRLNGIIGTAWDCCYTMENCYSVGFAPYRGNSARSASVMLEKGAKAKEVYKNVYTDYRDPADKESFTKLSSSQMNGSAAKSAMKGFDFENTWETVSGGTPKLKIFTNIDGKNIKTPDAPTVQAIKKLFESGSGTKSDPYTVTTAEQLKNVLTGSQAGVYYKMTKDIYINDVTKSNWKNNKPTAWVTNNTFSGNFDGGGHTVYGLYCNEIPAEGDIVSGAAGLFPKVSSTAVIRNVNVKEAYIFGKAYVGGIAGFVNGSSSSTEYALITGCTVDETVILGGQTVGGILGGGGGGAAIAYCSFTGTIDEFTGGSMRGNGIVGDIWSKNYKMAECFTLGYTVYRGSYLPNSMGKVYSTETQNGVLLMTDSDIYGNNAKTAMPELNWSIWKTVNGKIPVPSLITEKNDYKF